MRCDLRIYLEAESTCLSQQLVGAANVFLCGADSLLVVLYISSTRLIERSRQRSVT
jgi:hypothetical protein